MSDWLERQVSAALWRLFDSLFVEDENGYLAARYKDPLTEPFAEALVDAALDAPIRALPRDA